MDDLKQRLVSYKKRALPRGNLIQAATLIPLFQDKDLLTVLLTRRTNLVKDHKGQISFPGGVRDGDELLRTTALREAWEEMGIRPEDVQIFGELDDLPTVTGYLISPFVGSIPYPYPFSPNPIEIDAPLAIPVEHLLSPQSFSYVQVPFPRQKTASQVEQRALEPNFLWGVNSGGGKLPLPESRDSTLLSPQFEYEGNKVWGATARILMDFLAISFDWIPPREPS